MSNENTEVAKTEGGLTEEKKAEIANAFSPMISERDILAAQYDTIIKKDIDYDVVEEAAALRKKLVKVRTGIGKVHKTQKAFYLAAGKLVDSWKNKETLPVTQMEERLAEIEDFFAKQERERIEKVKTERTEKLQALGMWPDEMPVGLSTMEDDVFEGFYQMKKNQYDEAERKRKEEEEAERLRQEEEERKRKEEEERREAERKAQEEENRKLREQLEKEKAEKRRLAEEQAKKDAAKQAEIDRMKREKEEEEKRQEEIKRKQQEEIDRKAREEQQLIEAKARMGDKAKKNELNAELNHVLGKYHFKAKTNQAKLENLKGLIDEWLSKF